MKHKRFFLLACIFIGIGIASYLIPSIRHNEALFLSIIGLLAFVMAMSAIPHSKEASRVLRFLYPAASVLLFFIPLIIIEWIVLQSKEPSVNEIGIRIVPYEQYHFMPEYALLLTVSFGIVGAVWIFLSLRDSRPKGHS